MAILQYLKALGDSTRLRIAHILFKFELSVNELVQIMNMGQSRVSRHLKILTEAGLLQSRRDGLWVFYSMPANGRGAEFLNAIIRFLPEDKQFQLDLEAARDKLEERARKTRQFFNTIAETWDNLNHDILGHFDLATRVSRSVPKQCRTAVDLGCGTGEVIHKLLPLAENVIGVDGSAKMLELSSARLNEYEKTGRLSLRIGELHHLPLADQEANFACLNLVMHHLPQPEGIFPEIRRIMLPGARLFLADFVRHGDETMRSRYGDHWLGLDPDEVCGILEASKFTVIAREIQPVERNLALFLIDAVKQN